jgi:hypothetical protein
MEMSQQNTPVQLLYSNKNIFFKKGKQLGEEKEQKKGL